MLTANISLDIATLSDNEVAFANAAAWNNYWANVTGTAEFEAATTTIYTAVEFDTGLAPCDIVIDATPYQLVTTAQLASLLARVDALNNAFEAMRTQMRTAGYITDAQ